jgi:hypothetical protein
MKQIRQLNKNKKYNIKDDYNMHRATSICTVGLQRFLWHITHSYNLRFPHEHVLKAISGLKKIRKLKKIINFNANNRHDMK